MSELKPGDRVKVEFEADVNVVYATGVSLELPGSNTVWVPKNVITKIAKPLPEKVGAVIRCDELTWVYDGDLWNTMFCEPEEPSFFDDKDFEILSEGVDL